MSRFVFKVLCFKLYLSRSAKQGQQRGIGAVQILLPAGSSLLPGDHDCHPGSNNRRTGCLPQSTQCPRTNPLKCLSFCLGYGHLWRAVLSSIVSWYLVQKFGDKKNGKVVCIWCSERNPTERGPVQMPRWMEVNASSNHEAAAFGVHQSLGLTSGVFCFPNRAGTPMVTESVATGTRPNKFHGVPIGRERIFALIQGD